MSKLFIGMPREGRTEENYKNSISKAGELADLIFGEEFTECELSTLDWGFDDGETNLMRFAKNVERLSECSHAILFANWEISKLDLLSEVSHRLNHENTRLFNPIDFAFTKDIMDVLGKIGDRERNENERELITPVFP